jgi:hypothetical protein
MSIINNNFNGSSVQRHFASDLSKTEDRPKRDHRKKEANLCDACKALLSEGRGPAGRRRTDTS